MKLDVTLFYAFMLVFVRCSAMMVSSPLFGAQNTPLRVRIFTTMAVAGALTLTIKPAIGAPPQDMYLFVMAIGHEIVAGLLIGTFLTLILQAAQMAGSFIDLQMGLSMSQTLNPVTGVPVTIIAQFKYLLALVLFLSVDAHHVMLQAFVNSYDTMPTITMQYLPAIKTSFVGLITQLCLLALQIAAPVAGVCLVVDAALGVVNKAVPQMQVFFVGMPAKLLIGLMALSIGLPALAGSVQDGVVAASESLMRIFNNDGGG